MKRGLPLLFFFLFTATSAQAEEWVVTSGTFFDVHLKQPNEALAAEVLQKAESDFNRMVGGLGFSDPKRSWKNKLRVKILLYQTQKQFQQAGGAPEWSSGHAHYETRTIASSLEANNFLTSTLPHEIAHFILFDLTGSYLNVPKWLHEGYALAMEDRIRPELVWALKDAASKGYLLPLRMFTVINPAEQDEGGAMTYYSLSQALVRFMIDEHGARKFKKLILALSKGDDFNTAVEKTYKKEYKDLDELEATFFEWIKE